MSKRKNLQTQKKERESGNLGPLKDFFKWGENYVPHLSRKEKILARIIEEISAKKDSED
jgi:hypothetical protein